MVQDRPINNNSSSGDDRQSAENPQAGQTSAIAPKQNKSDSDNTPTSAELLTTLQRVYALTEENQNALAEVAGAIEKNGKQGDLISSLFAKIDSLEQDAIFRDRIRPVLMDVVQLYDRVELMCNEIAESAAEDKSSSIQLNSIRRELAQVLKRNGVEELDVLHKPFNESFSEAADKKLVDEPALHMVTVEVLRPAFTCHGRLLRPALVLVGEFKAENGEVSNE